MSTRRTSYAWHVRFLLIGGLASAGAACTRETAASSGAGAAATAAPAPRPATPAAQARQAVARGAPLIDVRTPEEFAETHLDGAVNIPLDELAARADTLVASRELVVYCRSGRRSAQAAATLRARGHAVIDLGPLSAW